jgi:hypothetical protein
MKVSQFRKLIREEVRKVLKEAKYSPGFKGVDINGYSLTIVAGPFMSFEDLAKAIKTKFAKAADILKDKDFAFELQDTDPNDVDGFYLVKGSGYGGSGYSVVNGEDISAE